MKNIKPLRVTIVILILLFNNSQLLSQGLTFANPSVLEEHSESLTKAAETRGLFIIPSLDLLTSLRMGGIRMGSLAINAKWKGH